MNSEKNGQDDSEQGMNEFFDLLGNLPLSHLGRNDPCLCGSGKKYKNCCLKKNQTPSLSQTHLESFEIKIGPLDPEEYQYNFPILSEDDQELMGMLCHRLQEHPETVESEDCDYFKQLNALRSKYPDYPVILNYIANGYQLLGQRDRAEELISETYEKFPDYLFARTA